MRGTSWRTSEGREEPYTQLLLRKMTAYFAKLFENGALKCELWVTGNHTRRESAVPWKQTTKRAGKRAGMEA